MQKRSSSVSNDMDEGAVRIVNAPTTTESIIAPLGKNPYAVALGRLGGLKGGPARMKKLSAKRRSEIAAKAARSRWKRKKQ